MPRRCRWRGWRALHLPLQACPAGSAGMLVPMGSQTLQQGIQQAVKVGSCDRHTNYFRLVRSKAWTSQAVRTGKQAATVPTRAQLNHTFVTPGAIR